MASFVFDVHGKNILLVVHEHKHQGKATDRNLTHMPNDKLQCVHLCEQAKGKGKGTQLLVLKQVTLGTNTQEADCDVMGMPMSDDGTNGRKNGNQSVRRLVITTSRDYSIMRLQNDVGEQQRDERRGD